MGQCQHLGHGDVAADVARPLRSREERLRRGGQRGVPAREQLGAPRVVVARAREGRSPPGRDLDGEGLQPGVERLACAGLGRQGGAPVAQGGDLVGVDGGEQVVAGRIVPVEGRVADARALGDLVQGAPGPRSSNSPLAAATSSRALRSASARRARPAAAVIAAPWLSNGDVPG